MIRERLEQSYLASVRDCRRSILDDLPPASVLLDYGCSDGALTQQFAARAGAGRVLGVEVFEPHADQARERGVEVLAPVDGRLPLDDGAVDVVTANQLIEHLVDTDGFVAEMRRILRPGGSLLVSTNNLASWHNIVALLLGAQPFPSDVSSNPGIGKLIAFGDGDVGAWSSWTHLRVFSYRALIEMMEAHGLVVQRVQGVGYYPLPARAGNRMARLDPRHAAYITVRAARPESPG